jgi:hypothetical protein
LVDGLLDIHFSKGVCEGCVLRKNPQEKFDKGKSKRASSPLDLIHSDVMGPFQHPSINKARFILIFVDDFSRFTWIYFMRKKSEVFQHLKDFKDLVETQSVNKIKVLQIDNGGVYVNHEIHNIFHEAWIQLQHTEDQRSKFVKKIKVLQIDNGGVYVNHDIHNIFHEAWIP